MHVRDARGLKREVVLPTATWIRARGRARVCSGARVMSVVGGNGILELLIEN
jgi:hypothetical protein